MMFVTKQRALSTATDPASWVGSFTAASVEVYNLYPGPDTSLARSGTAYSSNQGIPGTTSCFSGACVDAADYG